MGYLFDAQGIGWARAAGSGGGNYRRRTGGMRGSGQHNMTREALSKGLRGYQGAIGHAYAPMEIAPESPGKRYAWAVEGRRCGALGVTRIYARGRIRARIPESSLGDEPGNFILTYVRGGGFEFVQGRDHAVCASNSLVLMNATRPLEAEQNGVADLLSIVMPASTVLPRLPAIGQLCTRALPAGTGAAAILRDVMQSCWRERESLGAQSGHVLPGVVLPLLQAVFADVAASDDEHRRVLRPHHDILTVIERDLRNPDLCPDLVAQRLGISRSHLFALTRQLGTTVRRLIIDTRLEACRVALLDPSSSRLTITELALAFGFQDQAHFSRRFAARYGLPPRDYRAQPGQGPSPAAGVSR